MNKNLLNLRLVVLILWSRHIIASFYMSLYEILVMSIFLNFMLLIIELLFLFCLEIFSGLWLLTHHRLIHPLWFHVIKLIKVLLLVFVVYLFVLGVSCWCAELDVVVWLAMFICVVFIYWVLLLILICLEILLVDLIWMLSLLVEVD